MKERSDITVLGRRIEIKPRTREMLKGVTMGEKLSYTFYDGIYQGVPMLFAEPKEGNPTPRECDITSQHLSGIFGLPVVFIMESGPTYERQRLMDKGVFFVMSDRYAYLPMVVAMEKTSNRKKAEMATPVAEYLLLYHLQVGSLEGLSPREIAPLVPYSYESVTLGLTCLADLGLCTKILSGWRSKAIHFELRGKELWDKALDVLPSPVDGRIYCDDLLSDKSYPTCGINALASYTWLNPDKERMVLMTAKEYRRLKAENAIVNPNPYDGDIIIEVWKYPVVSRLGEESSVCDRLSLALSLRDDHDPRVEKEVERMIGEIKWMD